MILKELRIQVAVALALVVVALGVWWYFAHGATQTKKAMETKNAEQAASEWSGADIKTNYGTIRISFALDKAPKTVANFIALAEKGFYDGTKFHRVIADFMIQGGDPLSKDDANANVWGTGGPGYQFGDEINDEPFTQGAVAMANAGPNTNGSQFFIVTAHETPWLNGKHTIFARVTGGLDVALAINRVDTDARDVPKAPVVVEKVTLR